MKMIKLGLLGLLISSQAFASPITADQIYGSPGVTVFSGSGQYSFPQPNGTLKEKVLTESNTANLINKTFTDGSVNVAKQFAGLYDFATLSSASGADVPLGITLPTKAIITKATLDVITQPTSALSPTISIGVVSNVDIMAATAIASLTTGQSIRIEDGTGPNMLKLAAAATPTMHIRAASLSAGKFMLFLDYVISN